MFLGDLEGPLARIDRAGVVDALDDSWRIEWAVGCSDQWRMSQDDRTVHQTRIDDTPAFETRLQVPGGHVIQRAAATNDGLGRAVIMEFENSSPAAVVLAVVGRVSGAVEASADGISVDGELWMKGSRPAGGVVAVEADPWPSVMAEPVADRVSISGPDVGTALLLPIPHQQRVSFVAGVTGDLPTRSVTPAEVAAGWRTLTSDALTIDLPDPELAVVWRRSLCDLMVAAGSADPLDAAEAVWYLDVAGLHDEADRARVNVVQAAFDGAMNGEASVAALRALASRALVMDEPSGLAELAGPLAAAAGPQLDRSTLGIVAAALEAESPLAAADTRRLAETVDRQNWTPVTAIARNAEAVLGVVIAADSRADQRARISLLPTFPVKWRGQPLDVRRLVTGNGTVSFSVRWHGDRPAVLWECTGGPEHVIEISFPGLDHHWSSSDRTGEALLASPVRD